MRLCAVSVAVSVFILDRLTKSIVMASLLQGRSVKVLPGIFHFTLVLNKGAAFGFLRGQRIFFILLSILAALAIAAYIFSRKNIGMVLSSALGLVLGGTIGNLIDRVRLGYVIDFLDFRVWPVFNVADSAITAGVAILIIRILIFQGSGIRGQGSER